MAKRTIYDEPTRVLLKRMLDDINLQSGQVLTGQRVIEWFGRHYDKLAPASIRAHLVQASTNDPSRLHHKSTSETDDLLFKVGKGQYRRYEPGRDPAPIHEFRQGDVARQEAVNESIDDDTDEVSTEDGPQASSEFLLEKDLQRYLAENLGCIEAGLRLYEDEAGKGIEYDAGGRFIDILAIDGQNNLVIIELKVSKGYDRVVGQLLRYVNWVRMNIAERNQKVRGMIICRAMSEDLRIACSSIQDVELLEYSLKVDVRKVNQLVAPK